MKVIVAVFVSALLCVAVYLGWGSYKASQEIDFALKNVKTVAAQLAITTEMRKSDTVTFAEYFKSSSTALDEIDKVKLSLRTYDFSRRARARDVALEFATAAQEVIRLEAAHARSRMRLSSAKQSEDSAEKERESTANEYTKKYAYERAQKLRDEQIEILDEMLAGLKTLPIKHERVITADREVKDLFGVDEGLNQELISAFTLEEKNK
ncbi:hypothetical protein [Pseudomonas lactis]|uniref:hypothetical protein n=1 Tax=Pseudomonas lactis TaxID=1615674 RepID=UPI00054B5470|nr:hypothetical protein [Pseudomonas lactis]